LFAKELILSDFRNYHEIKLDFDAGINVLWGDNGAGKTNVLEAVYLASAGRSHRTARDKELVRIGTQNAFVHIKVSRKDGGTDVDIMIPQSGQRRIKVNGKYINRMAQLMGVITAVIFSPEDLKLIKEGPDERRRFIDIFASQIKPDYLYNLQNYYKVLENRNKILKDIKYGHASSDFLDIWDEQLAHFGSEIIKYRFFFVNEINSEIESIHDYITNGKEFIKLFYKNTAPGSAREFIAELRKKRDIDIRIGVTSVGPHRDDIAVFINDMDMRYYGSQGQQRTAALSLKLSQLKVMERIIGEPPILLLDDVMSELDTIRQNMLMSYMAKYHTMLTCAQMPGYLDSFDKKKVFHVVNGTIG